LIHKKIHLKKSDAKCSTYNNYDKTMMFQLISQVIAFNVQVNKAYKSNTI